MNNSKPLWRIFILILSFVTCGYHFSALSQNQTQNDPPKPATYDRHALVNRASSMIPGLLEFLSHQESFLNKLTPEERQQFEALLGVGQVRSQFMGRYHGRHAFVRNGPLALPDSFGDTVPQIAFFEIMADPSENFILNPDEGPRSAKTTKDFHSQILFNPVIMNSPDIQIGLMETIGILIHEFGHKIIVGKNQKAIDSVSVKILEELKTYLIKKSVNGIEFEILSLPLRIGKRIKTNRTGILGWSVPLIIHTGSQTVDVLLDLASASAGIRQLSEPNAILSEEMVVRLGKVDLVPDPENPDKITAKLGFQFANEFNRIRQEATPTMQIRKGRGYIEFRDRVENLFTGTIGQFEIETNITIPPPRNESHLLISPVVEISSPKGVSTERDAGAEFQISAWEITSEGLNFELTGKIPKLPFYLEVNSDPLFESKLLLEAVEIQRKKDSVRYQVKVPWAHSTVFGRLVSPNLNAALDLPRAAREELLKNARVFRHYPNDYPPFIEQIKIDATNLLDTKRPIEFVVQMIVESSSPLDYVDLRWIHGFELHDITDYSGHQRRLGHFGFMSHERVKIISEQFLGRDKRLITIKSNGGSHMVLPQTSDPRYRFFSSGTRKLLSATVVNADQAQATIQSAEPQDWRPTTKSGEHWATTRTRMGNRYLHPSERLKICLNLFR